MAVYPTSVKVEAKLNSIWTDISDDVVSNISGSYGIPGNRSLDRIATTGTFSFQLNNTTGKYSLTGAAANPYWKKGVFVRVIINYLDEDYIVHYGRLQDFSFDTYLYGSQRVGVTCADWIDIASDYQMVGLSIEVDKTADEAIQIILDNMVITPDNTDLDLGVDTFETVFDATTGKSTAYGEMAKLTMSEFGYLYLRKDKTFGDVLVFENRQHRGGDTDLIIDLTSLMDLEDGDELLMEDGISRFLISDTSDQLLFDNETNDMGISYSDNLVNQIKGRSYPRYSDDTEQVLYRLNAPMAFEPRTTKKVQINFIDPYGGGTRINGYNMVEPEAGVDFAMNQASDGSGTDDTAFCIFDCVYGASGATVTITNDTDNVNYIWIMQFRGYALFLYEPIDTLSEDDASIEAYGYNSIQLDMKYQSSSFTTESIMNLILEQEKEPRVTLDSVSFIANISNKMMLSFLTADIGTLIYVKDDKNNIDGYYNIQHIAFSITVGGIISFTWIVKDATSTKEIYWKLGVDGFTELDSTTILGY